MDAANIRILIEANSTGVASGLTPGLSALNRFEQDTKATLQRIGAAWNGLGTGTKVLAGFGVAAAAIGVGIAASIKPAIEFESAFAGVKKTVDGTPAQLAGIRDGLIQMSKEMPTTAKELAVIAENAGQLGVKAGDILNFTKVIAQLAETTDLDFDSAATQLARFLTITGGGPRLIDPVSNALVALGNAGASTESEIVDFAQRLASAFTVAGASEDQILALASAFASMGVRAEAGGSALSTIITSISDAAKGGNSHLATYARTAGLLPEQFKEIALSNPVEALLRFGEGLGEIVRAGGSVTPVMEAVELGGLRTSEVMRLLALNSDGVREALALAAAEMAGGTARQNEYDKRNETTAARLDTLRNNITAVQIAVGTNFLAGVAAGADAAAQGITFLVDVLAPLAAELRELFGNGAELARAFWDAIGSTGAKTAVAALVGAAVAVTALLDAFNSLGPAGVALGAVLAVLALYPPAMAAARAGVFAFALSMASVGPAGTAAAAGAAAFNAAVSVGPLIAFTAVLAATGKAWYDAGKAAKAAGAEIETAFDEAIKGGNFEAAAFEVEKLTNRMQTLRAELEGKNVFAKLGIDTGEATSFMSRLGTAITGTAEILTPFSNDVLNAQQELAELQRVAGENGFGLFQQNLESTAARLGISTDATLKLASEMGLLDDLVAGNSDQFYNAVNAMENYTTVAGEVGASLNLTKEQAIDNAMTLEELAAATDVSASALSYLAQKTDEIDFEKMFTGSPEERMEQLQILANKLRYEIDPLAASVGLTTEEFLGQVAAVDALAAAQDELAKAISGTKTALDSVNAQQRASTESAAAFQTALQGISGDFTTVEAAASAGRQAILDFAGTGAPLEDVTAKQAQLAEQLYATATAAGHEKEQVIGVIAELLRVPPSVVSEIIAKGEQAKLEAGIVDGLLKDLTEEEWEILIAAHPELAEERIRMLQEQANAFANAEYDAKLSANPELALHYTSEAKAQADAFAQAEYDAKLSANPELAIAGVTQATESGNAFAQGTYEAPITADNTDALAKIQGSVDAAFLFAGGTYQAPLTADDSDARAKTDGVVAGANKYAAGTYRAPLTADNSDAVAKTGQAQAQANGFAKEYTAILSAKDFASGVIGAAAGAAAGFARTYTATLTTNNVIRTSYIGNNALPALDGAVIANTGAKSFAGGGYYGGGADEAMFLGRSGPAFFPAIPGWARIFAEPATGGEWYIPRLGSRSRQYAIWSDAGKALGFTPHGGSGGTIMINAPIQIDASGSGADPEALAELISRRVNYVLADVARELENTRRS